MCYVLSCDFLLIFLTQHHLLSPSQGTFLLVCFVSGSLSQALESCNESAEWPFEQCTIDSPQPLLKPDIGLGLFHVREFIAFLPPTAPQ